MDTTQPPPLAQPAAPATTPSIRGLAPSALPPRWLSEHTVAFIDPLRSRDRLGTIGLKTLAMASSILAAAAWLFVPGVGLGPFALAAALAAAGILIPVPAPDQSRKPRRELAIDLTTRRAELRLHQHEQVHALARAPLDNCRLTRHIETLGLYGGFRVLVFWVGPGWDGIVLAAFRDETVFDGYARLLPPQLRAMIHPSPVRIVAKLTTQLERWPYDRLRSQMTDADCLRLAAECPHCHYDLRDCESYRCPECGSLRGSAPDLEARR